MFAFDLRFSLVRRLTYARFRHLLADLGSLDVWLAIAVDHIHLSLPLESERISGRSE